MQRTPRDGKNAQKPKSKQDALGLMCAQFVTEHSDRCGPFWKDFDRETADAHAAMELCLLPQHRRSPNRRKIPILRSPGFVSKEVTNSGLVLQIPKRVQDK